MWRVAETLLFLDVDGPLNPYAGKPTQRPEGYLTHRIRPASWVDETLSHRRTLRLWLHPGHGERLLALPYRIVWATTWGAEANEWISPRVGLPTDLPVAAVPDKNATGTDGVHSKTRPLLDYAAGRPFIWVDDEITDADRRHVAAHHPARALLHRVDARHGLRTDDFEALRKAVI
ncbi:hypothetical protein GCM10010435_92460 [Winogradskya consettensis]|uniref:Secreted protein n=1 Tax=Winogradskya consettensis TaxID=113560 RepID=A0A919SGH7_9ACTN|nr:hypothetical protein Aco04nite_23890 [Actinoplanes consettensis]